MKEPIHLPAVQLRMLSKVLPPETFLRITDPNPLSLAPIFASRIAKKYSKYFFNASLPDNRPFYEWAVRHGKTVLLDLDEVYYLSEVDNMCRHMTSYTDLGHPWVAPVFYDRGCHYRRGWCLNPRIDYRTITMMICEDGAFYTHQSSKWSPGTRVYILGYVMHRLREYIPHEYRASIINTIIDGGMNDLPFRYDNDLNPQPKE